MNYSIRSFKILKYLYYFFNSDYGATLSIKQVKVVVGTPRRLVRTEDTQEYLPAKFITHRKYSRIDLRHDIAIIRLKGQIVLSNLIQPVSLIKEVPRAGLDCTVSGWGIVFSVSNLNDTIHAPSPEAECTCLCSSNRL